MQEGFLAELSGEDRRGVVLHTAALLSWCSDNGVPVVQVITRHAADGSTWDRRMLATGRAIPLEDSPECDQPEEVAATPRDIVMAKTRMSAFYGTELEWELVRLGVSSVIVCGLYAHEAVLSTAIDAYQRDFRVAIPADCVASPDPEDARAALRQLGRTVAEIVDRGDLDGIAATGDEAGPYFLP